MLEPNTDKARIYRSDGSVTEFEDQQLAYFIWLNAPKGVRLAFRGKGDTRPVYPWNYVDQL
jgi:hypothetical protein